MELCNLGRTVPLTSGLHVTPCVFPWPQCVCFVSKTDWPWAAAKRTWAQSGAGCGANKDPPLHPTSPARGQQPVAIHSLSSVDREGQPAEPQPSTCLSTEAVGVPGLSMQKNGIYLISPPTATSPKCWGPLNTCQPSGDPLMPES